MDCPGAKWEPFTGGVKVQVIEAKASTAEVCRWCLERAVLLILVVLVLLLNDIWKAILAKNLDKVMTATVLSARVASVSLASGNGCWCSRKLKMSAATDWDAFVASVLCAFQN